MAGKTDDVAKVTSTGLDCKCRLCERQAPLKYSVENYTDKYSVCVACWPLVSFDKLPIARTCALCGKDAVDEFIDGIDFVALPNMPKMQKFTCSSACLLSL